MSGRIKLLGRIAIEAELKAKTGLAIGGGDGSLPLGGLSVGGLSVGGLETAVVRDPLTGEPYVPGSSLKGKLRALTERALGAQLVAVVEGRSRRDSRYIHRCAEEKEYLSGGGIDGYGGCPICHLYGAVPDRYPVYPTRLVTRDAHFTAASRAALGKRRTELPFTEVKSESVLDRITAASSPRHRERVPAGGAFEARWELNLYAVDGIDLHDEKLLGLLFAGLSLLEEDYLGGQGSRGYGRVEFLGLKARVSHDGGLSSEAKEFAAKFSAAGTVAAALAVAGNPLARAGS